MQGIRDPQKAFVWIVAEIRTFDMFCGGGGSSRRRPWQGLFRLPDWICGILRYRLTSSIFQRHLPFIRRLPNFRLSEFRRRLDRFICFWHHRSAQVTASPKEKLVVVRRAANRIRSGPIRQNVAAPMDCSRERWANAAMAAVQGVSEANQGTRL